MNQHVSTTQQELISKHIDSFPVLPATVARLMEVTNDPDSSAQDVMEAIVPDQSLCLTILKIANSALFGRPKKVDSIKMAIAVLGFKEVQRIALTKAIINSFSKLAKNHKLFIDKHWTHSFVCGIAAKTIAKDLHIAPEVAFMGGLIHDIGKLIMLETFGGDYAAEYWMTRFSNEEMLHDELQMFSFTHDVVGGQLLRKWQFPANLISSVANHHCSSEAIEAKALANIIQLADLLSFYCCNQGLLGDDGILPLIQKSLPDVLSQWQDCGLPATNETIEGWFDWLSNNYEEGHNLKEAF